MDEQMYEVFQDRAQSLLERWDKFKKAHKDDPDIDKKCIKGFLTEINDGYTQAMIEKG